MFLTPICFGIFEMISHPKGLQYNRLDSSLFLHEGELDPIAIQSNHFIPSHQITSHHIYCMCLLISIHLSMCPCCQLFIHPLHSIAKKNHLTFPPPLLPNFCIYLFHVILQVFSPILWSFLWLSQDELWKLEGPSAEEIQAAKAAAQKVPGTTEAPTLGLLAPDGCCFAHQTCYIYVIYYSMCVC